MYTYVGSYVYVNICIYVYVCMCMVMYAYVCTYKCIKPEQWIKIVVKYEINFKHNIVMSIVHMFYK